MLVDVVGGCDTPVCVEVGGLTAAAAAAAYLIGNGAVARGCGGGGFGFNIDIDAGEGFEANKKIISEPQGEHATRTDNHWLSRFLGKCAVR